MNKNIILCIDDEKMVLTSLKDQLRKALGNPPKDMLPILENNKYEIIIEENANDALDLLLEQTCKIPLVIADFIMPGTKGDKLLEAIHKEFPLTVNVMLTGQASIEGVTNAINTANLYKLLRKPWDNTNLESTVYEAIKLYENRLSNVAENQLMEERYHVLENEFKKLVIEYETNLSLLSDNDSNDKANYIHKTLEQLTDIKSKIELVGNVLQNLKDAMKSSLCANKNELYIKNMLELETIINNLHI